MSPLQPAFHSYSVPTSPAVSRSSKNYPVTPQRVPRQQHRHTQSFYRSSPITPSTPYTPLSLRSSDSNNTSALTTPDNFSFNLKKRYSFVPVSPEASRAAGASEESIANIGNNWRSRANENGIRVSSTNQAVNEQHYGDDEATDFSFSDSGNNSNALISDALLPSLFSAQPEHILNRASVRLRTQSEISAPQPPPSSPILHRNANRVTVPVSPVRSRQSQNQPMTMLSTPPPNRSLVKQLKLKGSLTDPAHTRRREAFGVIRTPQNINSSLNIGYPAEMSMELFDIDENEYEHDANYDISRDDESFSANLQAHQANTFGYLNYDYPSFPQYNSDPFQATGINFGYANSNLGDSVEHHFNSLQLQQNHQREGKNRNAASKKIPSSIATPPYFKPTHVPIPSADLSLPIIQKPVPIHLSRNAHSMIIPPSLNMTASDPFPASDCSVCLCQNPSSLAVLKPCGHPLCSACLTSALNIVGEKDMECAVCKQSVKDFKLVVNSGARVSPGLTDMRKESLRGKSFFDPLFSSPGSSNAVESASVPLEDDSFGDLESGLDFGVDFAPGEIRASTPKLENSLNSDVSSKLDGTTPQGPSRNDENVVLRIDNVPWDITPSQVILWLQQPVERVHVLLDGKGKTLSHTYVEIRDQHIAGAILRGEALGPDGKKKERGSVLGRGRRARGVTITRSSQEELMADLFPRWTGAFDGSRPSLAGLQGERIIGALEGGFLTENEVTGLLYLIREPDSHFLKVPSLPFYYLISLLSKFPPDVDSRVFWSASVRDLLFNVTHVAVELLVGRLDSMKDEVGNRPNDHGYSMELVVELAETAVHCQAFTSQQVRKLLSFASSRAIPVSGLVSVSSSDPECSTSVATPDGSTKAMSNFQDHTGERFGELAKEFGVQAELVQALAQRLANLA